MKIAICPGSFDPITKGHIDIIERSAKLFDKVIVLALKNNEKAYTFSDDRRLDFIRRSVAGIDGVVADCYDGLLVDYAKKVGASALVKGLRAVTDFEYEFQMALANKMLYPELETLFMNTNQEYMYLSSSLVKQIASFGGDISLFLPECILDDVRTALANK